MRGDIAWWVLRNALISCLCADSAQLMQEIRFRLQSWSLALRKARLKQVSGNGEDLNLFSQGKMHFRAPLPAPFIASQSRMGDRCLSLKWFILHQAAVVLLMERWHRGRSWHLQPCGTCVVIPCIRAIWADAPHQSPSTHLCSPVSFIFRCLPSCEHSTTCLVLQPPRPHGFALHCMIRFCDTFHWNNASASLHHRSLVSPTSSFYISWEISHFCSPCKLTQKSFEVGFGMKGEHAS